MKAVKITLILLTAAAAILFMKANRSLDIREALPFCDGLPPNRYHVAEIVILLIGLGGIARLRRRDDDE